MANKKKKPNSNYNPKTPEAKETIPLKRKTPILNWKREYFGHKVDNKKHGVGTILYSDGARFHGMFFNKKVLGLGIAIDTEGNMQFGFFEKQNLDIFGIHYFLRGDRFFGTHNKGMKHGVGI